MRKKLTTKEWAEVWGWKVIHHPGNEGIFRMEEYWTVEKYRRESGRVYLGD